MRRIRFHAAILLPFLSAIPVGAFHAQSTVTTAVLRTAQPATTAAILSAREAIWQAFFANDSLKLERLLPSAVSAGSNASWQNRTAVLEASRKFARSGGKLVTLKFEGTNVSVSGDLAVVTSTYTLEARSGDVTTKSTGKATEIFVRQDGRWVNPFWYLSSAK
jgi:hypothetical protein